MILYATNNHGFEALIVRNSRHVGPELGLKVVGETLLPLFGAEDHVDVDCWSRNATSVSSLRDLPDSAWSPIPALKRWAKLFSCYKRRWARASAFSHLLAAVYPLHY